MIPKASTLTKPKTPKGDVMEYVGKRIKEASESGYVSTRCWINQSDKTRVEEALAEAGYKVEEDKTEDRRVQLLILW